MTDAIYGFRNEWTGERRWFTTARERATALAASRSESRKLMTKNGVGRDTANEVSRMMFWPVEGFATEVKP